MKEICYCIETIGTSISIQWAYKHFFCIFRADGSCIYETNRDYFRSYSLPFDGSRRMLINNNGEIFTIYFTCFQPENEQTRIKEQVKQLYSNIQSVHYLGLTSGFFNLRTVIWRDEHHF